MSNYNLTCLALFGMLLIVTVASSSSSLLLPVTKIVSATTTTTSGANETAATATGNNNMTGVAFLFIQHAQSGSVSEVNATTSTLELSDVSDKTIMFSDRPDRIVTSQSTSDFVGNWSQGEDSFAVDPPNAVLVLDDEQERQDLAVIELYNPEYDSEANTLRYDISAENATTTTTTTTSINLPSEFGQSTLVIDGGGAIVSGGDANTASGEQSVVSGGDANTASGEQSVVAPSGISGGGGGGGSINNGEIDQPDSN